MAGHQVTMTALNKSLNSLVMNGKLMGELMDSSLQAKLVGQIRQTRMTMSAQ